MTQTIPQCSNCRHFHRADFNGNFCEAFPSGEGIPSSIIFSEVVHDRDLKGQVKGIHFQPIQKEDLDAES